MTAQLLLVCLRGKLCFDTNNGENAESLTPNTRTPNYWNRVERLVLGVRQNKKTEQKLCLFIYHSFKQLLLYYKTEAISVDVNDFNFIIIL